MRFGLTVFILLAAPLTAVAQQPVHYPATRKDSVSDVYFGTKVLDPYRWLEDQNAPEVARWVDAENKVAFDYLATIPLRATFQKRLTELWNTPRVGIPSRVAGRLFYSKNTGLQNQSVVYTQPAVAGAPRLLLDPNTLSRDGSIALQTYSVSPDGRLLGYGLAVGGSDWEEFHVRDIATGRELSDTVHWVKYSGFSWTNDSKGFFYTRFPAVPKDQILTAAAVNGKIYYHAIGTPDGRDRVIYQRPDRPDWYVGANVSEDGRFLFISLSHGTDPENLLYYARLGDPKAPDIGAAIRPLFTANDAQYAPLDNIGDTLFLQTTKGAPKHRIISIVLPDTVLAHAKVVVPEGPNEIESAVMAGHRVVTQTLEDVKSRLHMYDAHGKAMGDVTLPGIGSVGGLSSRNDTPELFYGFTSYLYPSTVFRYDFATGTSTSFQPPHTAFEASPYETRQVFYPSKDGTRIPMFVTAKKGTVLDGSHPTVLYAYGGFDISTLPGYSPTTAMWLEHGGVYVEANLRGGDEYGEEWHHAGRLDKKQNVFDDFIAAAEYLVKEKWTSPAHLAIHGYSNGGLLIGAVEEERPDLFAAAYAGAGVMDMLRYQKFSAGVGWVPEYGSSDNADQFRYLIKFSPVHNVKPGTCYPATIVTTADHDDRVVPGHSYKFSAAMQAGQGCPKPIVLRVETKTSHGYMPTDKEIAQLADVWAFTAWNTGMH